MTRFVDVLKADFQKHKSRKHVIAWAGNAEIQFDPITVAELEDAQRPGGTSHEQNLRMLIAKAKDASGQPLFSVGDLEWLRRSVAHERLIGLIDLMWASLPTGEGAKQAVEGDPFSGASSPSAAPSASP